MVQYSFLPITPPITRARYLYRRHSGQGKSLSPALMRGVGVLLVLRLLWYPYEIMAVEPPGFAQDCAGFAQDAMLGLCGTVLRHPVPTHGLSPRRL